MLAPSRGSCSPLAFEGLASEDHSVCRGSPHSRLPGLVCCPKSGPTTPELDQECVGGGGSHEWSRVRVIQSDVSVDRSREVRHVPEDAPSEAFGRKPTESALDEVQRGRAGRDEVEPVPSEFRSRSRTRPLREPQRDAMSPKAQCVGRRARGDELLVRASPPHHARVGESVGQSE